MMLRPHPFCFLSSVENRVPVSSTSSGAHTKVGYAELELRLLDRLGSARTQVAMRVPDDGNATMLHGGLDLGLSRSRCARRLRRIVDSAQSRPWLYRWLANLHVAKSLRSDACA